MNLKILLLTFILGINTLFCFSQTYDVDFHDGKVFFKLNDNIPNLDVNAEGNVEFNEDIFFYNALKEFKINRIYRPFEFNNDEILLRTYKIEFSEFEKIDLLIERLTSFKEFEYVEKVPLDKIVHVPNDPLYLTNTPNYNWNWHLDKIKATYAWDISTGSSAVKVAVVDNAIWVSHPDLIGKIVSLYDAADGD